MSSHADEVDELRRNVNGNVKFVAKVWSANPTPQGSCGGEIQGRPGRLVQFRDAATIGPLTKLSRLELSEIEGQRWNAFISFAINIRFNDQERLDVTEYCISEGWVRVPAGKTLDRKGQPLTIKLKGRVEAYFK